MVPALHGLSLVGPTGQGVGSGSESLELSKALICSGLLLPYIFRFTVCLLFQTSQGGFPGGTVVKKICLPMQEAGDVGLIPGLGRSPGVGIGNPLQYSCLENSMDRGAWRAIVHRVAKSWT